MKHLHKTLVFCTVLTGLAACGSGGSNSTAATQPAKNTTPVAMSQEFSVEAESELSGQLMGSDAEGDALVFALDKAPEFGSVEINPQGGFIYTPTADATGVDQLTFTVRDGHLVSTPATLKVTVTLLTTAFSQYSRQAFNQTPYAPPLAMNNREVSLDVNDENAYDDMLTNL